METFEPGIASAYSTHTFRTGEQGMKCRNCPRVMTIAEWREKSRCFCQSTNAVPAIARSAPPTRLETNRRTGLNPSNSSSNTPPRNPPTPTVNPRPTNSNTSFNSRNTTSSSSSSTTPSNSSRTQGSPSPSNINSNTPPINPPLPTVNPRPTNSNTSFNSRNTTSSSSSSTTPSNSSRTQGSPSPSNINSNTPPINPPLPTVNPRSTNSNTSFNLRNTTSSSSSFTTPSNSSRTQGSPSLSGWGCGAIVCILLGLGWCTTQLGHFSSNYITQTSSTHNQQPQLTPKEVVTRYYQLATSNREAGLALQSESFKSYWKQKDQDNKTEYFFNKFQKVDVYLFQTLTESPTKAKLKVWLRYVTKKNKTTCESQIMELSFDQSQGQWLIDKVSDVEYGLDCGK